MNTYVSTFSNCLFITLKKKDSFHRNKVINSEVYESTPQSDKHKPSLDIGQFWSFFFYLFTAEFTNNNVRCYIQITHKEITSHYSSLVYLISRTALLISLADFDLIKVVNPVSTTTENIHSKHNA